MVRRRPGIVTVRDRDGSDREGPGSALHRFALQRIRETKASMPLEILHGALVLLGPSAARKRAEIAPPAGLGILLARVQPVFSGHKLADHGAPPTLNVSQAQKRHVAPCSGIAAQAADLLFAIA